jgi:phosphoesterase RecJ-like protein
MGLTDIAGAIEKAQKIMLVAHIQPDGDTLGSCFALQVMLEKMGKEAFICCDGDMPSRYHELLPADMILNPNDTNEAVDLAIAVDCADSARLGKCLKPFKNTKATANIDHHVTNDGYAQFNYVSEASSVGEMIFELMQHCGIEPDEKSAQYLYIAISTDTGNFTYSNTNRKCLTYVAEMVELFDLRSTADVLFRRRSLISTQLIGRALSRLETFEDGRIAFVTLLESDLKEFGANSSDCDSIVDFAREIEETQAAVFFRELPHGVKISFRSKGTIDVGAVAAFYGGGGHAGASGCLASGKLDEVKKSVLEKLRGLL